METQSCEQTNRREETVASNINESHFNCKNTCSRKASTKIRGCPCKTSGVFCSDQCSCGTVRKGCQNKPEIVAGARQTRRIDRNESTLTEEDERTMENTTVEISFTLENSAVNNKQYIETLHVDELRQLCSRALCRGVGSMEYVKSLLAMDEDHDGSAPGGSDSPYHTDESVPDWCKCNNCRNMNQEIENKCCGRRLCVTSTRRFQKLCLDPDVLELCIRNRADIRNDCEDNSTSAFRKAAYRQFILETYGHLGKGNRKVAPSCVVIKIRQYYPSPTNVYMGFRPE